MKRLRSHSFQARLNLVEQSSLPITVQRDPNDRVLWDHWLQTAPQAPALLAELETLVAEAGGPVRGGCLPPSVFDTATGRKVLQSVARGLLETDHGEA